MAIITTAGSGDWASTTPNAPWPSGTLPTTADTVVIRSVDAITVTSDQTFGPSNVSRTTLALTINSGGSLTITNGATLNCRGAVQVGNNAAGTTTLQLGDGVTNGTFVLDASVSNVGYQFALGAGTSDTGARLIINGVSKASRSRLTSTGTTKGYWLNSTNLGVGTITLTNAKIDNLGTSTTAENGFTFYTGPTCSLTDVIFDTCGRVMLTASATSNMTLTRVITRNTVIAGSRAIDLNDSAALTSGTRQIRDCVFDGGMWFGGIRSLDINGMVVRGITSGRPFGNVSGGTTVSQWTNVAVIEIGNSGGGGMILPSGATFSNTYFLHMNIADVNPHFVGLGTSVTWLTSNPNVTLSNWIFEAANTASDGDCILVQAPTGAANYTLTVQGCMVLPNDAGTQSGNLMTGQWATNAPGGATPTLGAAFNHNTFITTGTQCGIATNEATNQPTGAITAISNNLAWRPTSGLGGLFRRMQLGTAGFQQDQVAGANCFNNGKYNITTAGAGHGVIGYSEATSPGTPAITGTPGTNDIANTVNPNFLDSTRRSTTFAVAYLGASAGASDATKRAATVAALLVYPDSSDGSYNVNATPSSLLNWVVQGWAPTNPTYKAASDAQFGGWIGASTGISGDSITERRRRRAA